MPLPPRLSRRVLLSTLAAPLAFPANHPWTPLLQANSLDGWHTEGQAVWAVSQGVLTGRQGPAGAAGDLFTESHWKDFELEAEWRMHWPGNSGIWFRVSAPKTGYQADFLDQSSHPGVLSGSLYCMGKAFIAENRDAASVHKDAWNRLHLSAQAAHIVVHMNGRQVVDVKDATFSGPGSIGIQIHAGKAFDGMEVQVRNFRIRAA